MSESPVITVHRARKAFGKVVALDDVSWEVERGEIFGLLGPNGAGKTTALDCIEGLKRLDSGRITVFGRDAWLDRRTIRNDIGVQLQEARLQARIKVWEAIDLFASFYPHPIAWSELLGPLGLAEKRDALFGDLSGGQKQRLFVALAMVGDGELLFLDELTTGLDPHARHAMWDLVLAAKERGKTIVLTTHFMEEAETLCDRVAIMDRGRIVAVDSPGALVTASTGGTGLTFISQTDFDIQRLIAVAGVTGVERRGERVMVRGGGDKFISDVTSALEAMECRYREMRSSHPTLEDVFLEMTGHQLRD